ncbi:MAG: hypothetical protein COB10_08490 [Planctomycetota bacterium]|nr:MAG: hypothetical protein COB10_08490 [Planctomycetota bacterium]
MIGGTPPVFVTVPPVEGKGGIGTGADPTTIPPGFLEEGVSDTGPTGLVTVPTRGLAVPLGREIRSIRSRVGRDGLNSRVTDLFESRPPPVMVTVPSNSLRSVRVPVRSAGNGLVAGRGDGVTSGRCRTIGARDLVRNEMR